MDESVLENELWIDKLAKKTKCEHLGQKLFRREGMGPYLLFLIFPCIMNMLIIHSITYLRFGWYPPGWPPYRIWTVPAATIFGIWGLKKMRNEYNKTIKELNLTGENKQKFSEIASRKAKMIINGKIFS